MVGPTAVAKTKLFAMMMDLFGARGSGSGYLPI